MWKLGKYASYGECQYSTHFPKMKAGKKGQHTFLFNPIIIFEYSTELNPLEGYARK